MLFNSYEYVFAFLPLTAVVFFLLARAIGSAAAMSWLVMASLFFYGWWNPVYLSLICILIVFNYSIGLLIQSRHRTDRPLVSKKVILVFGIAANLAVLSYYKYAAFIVGNLVAVTGADLTVADIVLPLGISFFTFQKIAFLVDVYRGEYREVNFLRYCLFVLFFPQLIAGPIVHPKEVLPQFGNARTFLFSHRNVAIGVTIFIIGLFKKVVLADNIAPYSNSVFDSAARGETVEFFTAWGGALAYTFQLYFDFSGYSDMAIGAARIFGVRLPQNFYSPYKAISIIDFWRRWHMTLSRFLRDYLYFALGGNRAGAVRRHVNLLLTMLLGGLWHGAAWTFVAWGALHGAFLILNHGWRAARQRLPLGAPSAVERGAAWMLTFAAVVSGWVLFRATSFESAMGILKGMAGLNGFGLPAAILLRTGAIGQFLLGAGVEPVLGGGSRFVATWSWCICLGAIALLAPNTQQVLRRYRPVLSDRGFRIEPAGPAFRAVVWKPSLRWAVICSVLFVPSLFGLAEVTEFLYFQF